MKETRRVRIRSWCLRRRNEGRSRRRCWNGAVGEVTVNVTITTFAAAAAADAQHNESGDRVGARKRVRTSGRGGPGFAETTTIVAAAAAGNPPAC